MSSRKPMYNGDRFGHLTIIDDTPIKKNNRYYYLCQCDCGKERLVSGTDLRSGHSQSCGCTKGEKLTINMIGKKFGRLEVLNKEKSNKRGLAMWKCKCDCGNIVIVAGSSLRNGYTQSCGCLQKEIAKERKYNLTGKRFGKLIALQQDWNKDTNKAGWKCQCDCGNIITVATSILINNKITSCGCVKSKGEFKIIQILKENNIIFQTQYKIFFQNSNRYFDFAIFDSSGKIKYFIEYDGKQHFNIEGGWGESLNDIQARDNIKNQWCEENNIPLIRIPYTQYENLSIKDLLLETTSFLYS